MRADTPRFQRAIDSADETPRRFSSRAVDAATRANDRVADNTRLFQAQRDREQTQRDAEAANGVAARFLADESYQPTPQDWATLAKDPRAVAFAGVQRERVLTRTAKSEEDARKAKEQDSTRAALSLVGKLIVENRDPTEQETEVLGQSANPHVVSFLQRHEEGAAGTRQRASAATSYKRLYGEDPPEGLLAEDLRAAIAEKVRENAAARTAAARETERDAMLRSPEFAPLGRKRALAEKEYEVALAAKYHDDGGGDVAVLAANLEKAKAAVEAIDADIDAALARKQKGPAAPPPAAARGVDSGLAERNRDEFRGAAEGMPPERTKALARAFRILPASFSTKAEAKAWLAAASAGLDEDSAARLEHAVVGRIKAR